MPSTGSDAPRTFRDPWAPRQQIQSVLNFYYPAAIDDVYGGYVAQLDERDGHVYDGRSKSLTATCRAIFNFCVGERIGGPDWCRSAAEHGVAFLLEHHYDHERGGFDQLLEGTETADDTRQAYGHAFALLALSAAAEVDIPGAAAEVEAVYDLIDEHFWEPEHGLCADRASGDWAEVAGYRGQNANMHTCEATLAAYEATGEGAYLDRSYAIAESLVRDLAADTDGLIWEHYTEDWEQDFEYGRDGEDLTFRPWGYQPGHHAEWTKLLLQLAEHREEEWLTDRAEELFEWATSEGWDDEYGGFYYTVAPDGDPVVTDKYGWPVAEAIGASALLGDRVDDSYWEWYDRFWTYARENLINPKYGIWYQRVSRENEYDPSVQRDVAVEPGYHPLNNALVAMRVFGGE
jgi:mannose/cellobiose epimerase-like protein (N-acyl-D-glucosamine 2-epimerase family)